MLPNVLLNLPERVDSILKHAVELGKPVMMLNIGPTRADDMPGVEKIEWKSGDVLRDVCHGVLGTKVRRDEELGWMLTNGVIAPPVEDVVDALPTE